MIQIIAHGNVRELRLHRPPVNALSPELVVALRKAIETAPAEGVRGLVLSGAPGRFSGGLDVPLLLGLDQTATAEFWKNFYWLLGVIAGSTIPVVCAITGHAPAGGIVLGLFCDWRVMASGDYKVGLNEVQVGIPLPPVILSALQRQVGFRRAEWLAVTGALLAPAAALEAGLVDELAHPDRVVQAAIAHCQCRVALPPEAMGLTRRQARADLTALFEVDLEQELRTVMESWWSSETQTALGALVERLGKKGGYPSPSGD